jgi:hypothetical protein
LGKLQTILFITENGGSQELKVQDYSDISELEYWGDNYSEAVDGSLRSNVKGVRKMVRLSYNLCAEPNVYSEICSNIVADFNDGAEFFYFGLDSDSVLRVVIDNNVLNQIKYNNQHGLFTPVISMKGYQVGVDIEVSFEDWGYINEAGTEFDDYGLIADSVDEFEDYGFVA